MLELLRTNDIVLISRIETLLEERGIGYVVFDAHMSALEGSIGILPRRVMVPSDDMAAARRALTDFGLGAELSR
jgi:hypothetical protein